MTKAVRLVSVSSVTAYMIILMQAWHAAKRPAQPSDDLSARRRSQAAGAARGSSSAACETKARAASEAKCNVFVTAQPRLDLATPAWRPCHRPLSHAVPTFRPGHWQTLVACGRGMQAARISAHKTGKAPSLLRSGLPSPKLAPGWAAQAAVRACWTAEAHLAASEHRA